MCLDAAEDGGVGAVVAEDGAAVADALGVEGEARVPAEELHDVARGVGTDAGKGEEEVEGVVVRCCGVFEPAFADVAAGEEACEFDEARVAVADAAAGAEGAWAGAGEAVGGGERAGAADDLAEAAVHVHGAGPGDVATGDGLDDVLEEGR